MYILMKRLMVFGLLGYSCVMIILLFFRGRGFMVDETLWEYIRLSSNFVPFHTISLYVQAMIDGTMNLSIPITNLFGNLFAFLPLGIFLPFFIKELHRTKVFASSILSILLIVEAVQLVTRRGSFDVDDLILNMIGALAGFAIWCSPAVQAFMNRLKTKQRAA